MIITKLIVILSVIFAYVICFIYFIRKDLKEKEKINELKRKSADLARQIAEKEAEIKFYDSIRATTLGEFFDKRSQ